jgi:hypothetical protein
VIPPEADAEFAANMENTLETYEKPYDADVPVVCMDEQPVQLIKETRSPIAGTKEHPQRVDYEYERAGTASIFMFNEPLAGWRQATARERRTKTDWAEEVAVLLEGRYANCKQVILVCDNLNTHTKGAFYKAFEPDRARQLAEHRGKRTEFDDPSMSERPTYRQVSHLAGRNRRVVHRRQQHTTRRRLANENRRRTLQTQINLP